MNKFNEAQLELVENLKKKIEQYEEMGLTNVSVLRSKENEKEHRTRQTLADMLS